VEGNDPEGDNVTGLGNGCARRVEQINLGRGGGAQGFPREGQKSKRSATVKRDTDLQQRMGKEKGKGKESQGEADLRKEKKKRGQMPPGGTPRRL